MSQFSTGELAKAAEVSVRTVQYYDQRGILTPSEVTEGGRRIYHESDLERLQVICFLRDLDFSIKQIQKLLQEENREQVLELLLTDQIESLEKSSKEIEVKLKRARHLQKATAKWRTAAPPLHHTARTDGTAHAACRTAWCPGWGQTKR